MALLVKELSGLPARLEEGQAELTAKLDRIVELLEAINLALDPRLATAAS